MAPLDIGREAAYGRLCCDLAWQPQLPNNPWQWPQCVFALPVLFILAVILILRSYVSRTLPRVVVPEYKPAATLAFIKAFVTGEEYPRYVPAPPGSAQRRSRFP